jgi:hypothetical protein
VRIDQFEHALRAMAGVTNHKHFIILGTASVLAQHPQLDERIVTTIEVDAWPNDFNPETADVLECIGEMSAFHSTHGFYIDPYNPHAAILPEGWRNRLVAVTSEFMGGATAHCVETHDVAVSKIARGEPKDFEFLHNLLRLGLIHPDTLSERIESVNPDQPRYQLAKESPVADIRLRLRKNLSELLNKSVT